MASEPFVPASPGARAKQAAIIKSGLAEVRGKPVAETPRGQTIVGEARRKLSALQIKIKEDERIKRETQKLRTEQLNKLRLDRDTKLSEATRELREQFRKLKDRNARLQARKEFLKKVSGIKSGFAQVSREVSQSTLEKLKQFPDKIPRVEVKEIPIETRTRLELPPTGPPSRVEKFKTKKFKVDKSKSISENLKVAAIVAGSNINVKLSERRENFDKLVTKIKRVFNVPEIKPQKGIEKLLEGTSKVGIPESLTKETPIRFIEEPPKVTGGTVSLRSIDFRDVDKGRLPPKQNLEIKSNKILTDFSTGKISEDKALNLLEQGQKKFVLDESKRTAGLRVVEGLGIGALALLVPPVGLSIIGLSGVQAIRKRREIINFAKRNPKAAAIQFVAGALGGFLGAGGISALKVRSATIKQPTLELTGKARTKLTKQITERLEPELKVELDPVIKKTATRTFEIDIPSPNNKVTLKIVEFSKDGKKSFAGLEFINGKPKSSIVGETIAKGEKGSVDLITRSIKTNSKRGLTNVEVAEFFERATLKASKKRSLQTTSLTKSETKLASRYKLRGLKSDQVREVLRRPLFGEVVAKRKTNQPFTESEFKLAKDLTNSEVAVSSNIVKVRVNRLNEQVKDVLKQKDTIDIRAKEVGKGLIHYEVSLGKPIKFKGKIDKGIVKPVGKVPTKKKVSIEVEDFTRIKVTKTPQDIRKKTPLSETFSQQTQQILRQEISPKRKVQRLEKLTKDVDRSPTGSFMKIAKIIQKERLQTHINKILGKLPIKSSVVGGKVISKSSTKQIQSLIQKKKLESSLKQKISTPQVSRELLDSSQRLALAGKLSQPQLQRLKQKLVLAGGLRAVGISKPTPRIPKLPIKIPSGLENTPTLRALLTLRKKGLGVDVVSRKKGKEVTIFKNLNPFVASKKAQKFVDKNIAAAYTLRPSGKKATGKKEKPINIGRKFVASKKNPLFINEKRKFRLDSFTEKRQIKRRKK